MPARACGTIRIVRPRAEEHEDRDDGDDDERNHDTPPTVDERRRALDLRDLDFRAGLDHLVRRDARAHHSSPPIFTRPPFCVDPLEHDRRAPTSAAVPVRIAAACGCARGRSAAERRATRPRPRRTRRARAHPARPRRRSPRNRCDRDRPEEEQPRREDLADRQQHRDDGPGQPGCHVSESRGRLGTPSRAGRPWRSSSRGSKSGVPAVPVEEHGANAERAGAGDVVGDRVADHRGALGSTSSRSSTAAEDEACWLYLAVRARADPGVDLEPVMSRERCRSRAVFKTSPSLSPRRPQVGEHGHDVVVQLEVREPAPNAARDLAARTRGRSPHPRRPCRGRCPR